MALHAGMVALICCASLLAPPLPAANCPSCSNAEAYFYEMQTRSADEPATVFYRCSRKNCNKVWTEN